MSRIPEDCLIGITVVLITCSYRLQEFIRIGYYVNNSSTIRCPQVSQIERCILADKPRITHTPINWNDPSFAVALNQPVFQTKKRTMIIGNMLKKQRKRFKVTIAATDLAHVLRLSEPLQHRNAFSIERAIGVLVGATVVALIIHEERPVEFSPDPRMVCDLHPLL